MPDPGDYHGYRASTSGWKINDLEDTVADAGGTSLTGWGTDGSGNLVNTGTGQVLAADGSQAAPSYAFGSDPTTGIWSFGGDIQFSIGGTRFLTLNSGGALASINDSPWRISDGTADSPGLSFVNAQGTGLFRPDGGGLGFSNGGVETWRIGTDGKLIPQIAHEVPASPTVQQVVTVLVALGILTQAA